MNAENIIRAISDAAARWSNADFPPRVRATAALIRRTGYSEPVVDFALDQLFAGFTAAALRAVITAELGSVAALDGFMRRPGQPALYARGLAKCAIIASQTTIGVALPAAMFALIAKSRVTVKDREDGLVRRFFATVVEEEPLLAGALHAEAWEGAQTKGLDDCDVVVAFGRSETLSTIRAHLAIHTRFLGFGPGLSCGIIRPEIFTAVEDRRKLFRSAARDVMLYEAEGCMSLHLVFILIPPDQSHRLETYGQEMSEALEAAAIEFPPAHYRDDQRLLNAAARSRLRFATAVNHDRLIEQPHSAVVLTESAPPAFQPGTLVMVSVQKITDILAYVQKYQLKIMAVSIMPEDHLSQELALSTGALRITAFGCLQQPALQGEHGGRARIRDFVECITSEVDG